MGRKKKRPQYQWVREDMQVPERADDDAGEAYQSRTQRRDEARALDALGKELVAMPNARLQRLPLSDALREAIALARRITSHEASRRQMQFIGRLLRSEDVEGLREAMADEDMASRNRDRQLGRWQRRILDEGMDAINAFVAEHRGADRQRLRSLWRAACKDPEGRAGPLLRYLYEAVPR